MVRNLLFACLFLSVTSAPGQGSPFIFHHLKEKDGLSNNSINCFLKDSRGILWVGTVDGLNRFDGSHFYIFKKKKQANSIINNVIHSLCEDKQRNIWGATDNGIFCYNPETNVFKNYLSPNSRLAPSTSNIARAVYNIMCDSRGNIWATGIWTVLKFNSSKDVFEENEPLAPSSDSLYYYEVRKNGIIEDPSGDGLWLATRRGIHFYNFKTRQVLNFKNHRDTLFTGRRVAALYKSASGQFWFFDNNAKQIFGFDPATRTITRRIDMAAAMPDAIGATLFEDSEHRLWFSSWSAEIAVVDLHTNNITRLKNDKNDPLSIAGDFFWCAAEDKDGTLWLGTLSGISKCNASKSLYKIYRMEEKLPFLKGNSIRLMVEDPTDKSWWLVTRNTLFAIHYFPESGKHDVYDFQLAEKDIRGALPAPVFKIRFINNKPVLCTHTGAWQIEATTHKIIPFTLSRSIDADFVIRGMVEQNGIYYLSDGKEIIKYDSFKDKVDRIKYPYEKLKDGQPHGIGEFLIAKDNKIWFSMAIGWLGYLDEKNEIIPIYTITNKDEEMNGYFTSIAADKKGKFWLANRGIGLYSVDPSNRSTKYWTEADGLIHNIIDVAVPDDFGNVWCVAYNKFSVFTPSLGSFYNFTLPLSEANLTYDNGLTRLSNGNILASVQNDLVEFYPERLSVKPNIIKPFIGSINIAGKEKFIDSNNSVLLDPEEKFLSIKFGMLTDNETFPYSFEYKLEGIDENWVTTGVSNQAVYNKLPAGKYTFHLIARAKNGAWQSPETTMKIKIRTAFFKSAWFYTLIIVIVSVLLLLFYRFRINKQRQLHALTNKAQLLEKEKTLVMYESLKQQLNPHFLFNSLTSLNSLIETEPKAASVFLDSLSKTYRYVLKSRDNETVPLIDEIKFAENYVKLQTTRFEKGFIVNMSIPEEFYHRKIVPVALQNMIENAIKHNIIDEDSPLQVDIFIKNDYVVVQNNLQKKKFVETSNKHGLVSMESLYRYLSNRPVEIDESNNFFTVKIPLL